MMPAVADRLVRDPACGTLVDRSVEPPTAVYGNREYWFCSLECRAAFVRNPTAFVPRHRPSRPTEGPLGMRVVLSYLLGLIVVIAILSLGVGLLPNGWRLAFTLGGAAAIVAALGLYARRARPPA